MSRPSVARRTFCPWATPYRPSYGINAALPANFFQTSSEKFAGFYGYGNPRVDLQDYGASATAVYSLDRLDLTSISAFRRNDSLYLVDGAENSPPIIPEYINLQKHFSAGIDRPINSDFKLVANWLTSYTGGETMYLSAIQGVPNAAQGGYWLTNFKVGVSTMDNKYRVALYATNLFDRPYHTVGSTSSLGTS